MIWISVKNSLPNLQVLRRNNVDIGFIEKPNDTATCKNYWRCFVGIGDKAVFVDHQKDKKSAKKKVEEKFK